MASASPRLLSCAPRLPPTPLDRVLTTPGHRGPRPFIPPRPNPIRSAPPRPRRSGPWRLTPVWIGLVLLAVLASIRTPAVEFRGRVVDHESGQPIPARVYLQNAAGEWLFVTNALPEGSALPYREQWVPMAGSIEQHTTLSAHPFRIDLPPGDYSIEIERGKEYLPLQERISVSGQPVDRTFRLVRWIRMADRGWYSGETHVHRRLVELPNVMLAEDLNVAFPVTFWTIEAGKAPDLAPSPLRRQGPSPFGPREDRGHEPIFIDPTHVLFPRNTEYEIFSVGRQPHVLGAVFVLNHRSVPTQTAPPIGPIAARAHAEGALLDLDKHAWPWSVMLVPIAGIDLFELSNNSVWRTRFGFKQASVPPADWMEVEMESPGQLTEWGWLDFGFQVYYAFLNCGFRLAPTAGTASGVHPVPLGHSRVYVHTGTTFDPARWLAGLKAGRSFVTTGPMLFATLDQHPPGEDFTWPDDRPQTVVLDVECLSARRPAALEVVVNGSVTARLTPEPAQTPEGAWRLQARHSLTLHSSSWVAVRCLEPQPDGRKRFAHTAPWHLQIGNRPVTPRRREVDYLLRWAEKELERNRPILSPAAVSEFERAVTVYRDLLRRAK